MKVNKHICFGKEKAPELAEYLVRNNIPFQMVGSLLTVDILQSDPYWEEISKIVDHRQLVCLSDTTFSKKELASSQWLSVRSKWMNGYPQPENDFAYRTLTYDDNHHCELCGNGLHQKAPFRMKSVPKWGNRHFMMLNWVRDELFIDDCAKEVLQSNHFSGFEFTEVQDKKGTCALPGIYQMTIPCESAVGMVENQESVEHVRSCARCGQRKFHLSGIGMYSIYGRAFDDMPDVCKSAEVFGGGKSAHRLIFIRQAVYRAITEKKLDRGLVFTPIDMT